MIIRCKSCVSAFAVDDGKVADRKFAFTCPKCGTENIIDNRHSAAGAEFNEPVSNDLLDNFQEEAAPAPEKAAGVKAAKDIYADEKSEVDFSFDDDILSGDEESGEKPGKKSAPDDSFADELDLDTGVQAEKAAEEMPEPDFADIELENEFASFDAVEDKAAAGKDSDREKKITEQDEIDAMFAASDGGRVAGEDVSVDLDNLDIDFEAVPAAKDKSAPAQDHEADDVIFFDDEPAEEQPAAGRAEEDIEALDIDTMDLTRETAAGKKSGAVPAEEDITIDIDSLDIDVEESEPAAAGKGPEKKAAAEKIQPEDEVLFDLDIPEEMPVEAAASRKPAVKEEPLFDFDITDDESEKAAEPEGRGEELVFEADEDVTLDIDSLDIDIEEPVHESIKSLPEKREAAPGGDESITLDVDSLDIDIVEPEFDKEPSKGELPEEDIEIDLDSLDFDTEEAGKAATARPKNVREIMKEQAEQGDDEDIKLNLDELDIDIDEISEKDMDFVKKAKTPAARKSIIEEAPEDEDESITIDLDTLDIDVAENTPVLDSEISEEDEKLTLEDAGITFDELTTSGKNRMDLDLDDEEDIKLTLDEVDPEMRLEQIGEAASPDEPLLVDTIDELPEIDLDGLDEQPASAPRKGYRRIVPEEDLDIDVYQEDRSVKARHAAAKAKSAGAYHARGTTMFTVDFSLKYSRVGALLRLLFLYLISIIPHFIVLFIYTLLSGILGFINQIVILSTGRCVEDFAQIVENTLRYYLYIKTCVTGIVEDRPEFAGRERIDHQMQLNLTYPLQYSRLLAALRLSVAGIFIITLPHIVMLWFITLFVPFVYLAGIIWVIITGRWPNPLFMFLTMYFRYMARISSFMIGLTDQYPPFRLE